MTGQSDHSAQDRIQELEKQISALKEENILLNQEKLDLSFEKNKYQLIADFSNDWDFWLNPAGNFNWISPSCHDLTGYSAEEFFNDPDLFNSIIHPDDKIRIQQYLKSVLNFSTISLGIEFRILTRTKQLRWCELNSKGMFDRIGSYLGQRCSIRDITRLMTALGQISEMSDKQVREMKIKNKYRDQLAGKDRELISSLIEIARKNEILLYTKRNLTLISNSLPPSIQPKVAEMLSKISEHLRKQSFNPDEFKLHFEKVHPGFFMRLKGKFPTLTTNDQRICAYIRLGLSTKEIAGLINITSESTEIKRVRLRKKMGLGKQVNLTSFLQQL